MSRARVQGDAQVEVDTDEAKGGFDTVKEHFSPVVGTSEESLISLRKPRGFGSGLSSGVKNVVKGTTMGIAMAVATPYAVYKTGKSEGVKAAVLTTGTSLVSAVSIPMIGAVCGAVQVGRGIFQSGEGHLEERRDKIWNQEKRAWEFYYLPEEARVLKEEEDGFESSVPVKDMKLYKLLGAETTDSQAEIKRKYFAKAKQMHPDRVVVSGSLSKQEATVRFQELAAAYHVLKDPTERHRYNRQGMVESKSDELNMTVLLTLAFGSPKFMELVGEMDYSSLLARLKSDSGDDDNLDDDKLELHRSLKERRRQLDIAQKLVTTLESFVGGDEEKFVSDLEKDIHELSSHTKMGAVLVGKVGRVYSATASSYLGFGDSVSAGLGLSSLKRLVDRSRSRFTMVKTTLQSLRKVYKIYNSRGDTEDVGMEVVTGALDDAKTRGLFVKTVWSYALWDFTTTVEVAAEKIVKDSSVPKEVRILRAKGLALAGQRFQAAAPKDESAGLRELGERLAEAVTIEKDAAQEAV